MNVREGALLPYERERRQRRLELAAPVGLGAATLATGLTTAAAGQVAAGTLHGFALDSWSPGAASQATLPLHIASGAMALANTAMGIYKFSSAPEDESQKARNWRLASGIGNLVVAAGMAGQALGWPPWTMIVAGAGVLATITAETVRTYSK